MKTELIVVGKTTNKHFLAAINDYLERIGHYMPFSVTVIPELRNAKSLSQQQQKDKEGEAILRLLQPSDTVGLLDERGKEPRSIELADWLQRQQQTARRLVFIIGGPYGLDESIKSLCDMRLSLSEMTFNHRMARLLLLEQIYRALNISAGGNYHK